MSMIGKKAIRDLEIRKPIAVTPLIKCYICNQHFQKQSGFQLHQQEHQNKLSKTNIDQIQRKTQGSFRSKKQITSLNKTQLIGQDKETRTLIESKEKPQFEEKDQQNDEKQEKQIEFALRQSQILLQKIEFMTQVAHSQQQNIVQPQKEEDSEQIKKWIENQCELYKIIVKSDNKTSIEKLILETNFQEKYFENYQQQLKHLRLLATVAVKAESITKIVQIRRNICQDVSADLQKQFSITQEKQVKKSKKTNEEPKINQNKGEIAFCADCYGNITVSEQFYSFSCGHNYHKQCWSGSCC